MVTPERLAYINENLCFGDKKEIEKKTKVPYATVDNVLNARSFGKHGDVVINAAEKIIKLRLAKIEKEKLLYGNAKDGAVVS
jgi:hypothetical protein